jgi:hypothetical protein
MILESVLLKYGVKILSVSLIFLIIGILYRRALKKWNRNKANAIDFVTLYALENPISKATVEFLFEQKAVKNILFTIEDKDGNVLKTLYDGESKTGMHILKFNTLELPDGNYFFVLKTPIQSTAKLMRIRNDNPEKAQ